MTRAELNKILELHKKWLNDEPDGKNANLHFAVLRNAVLRDANLCNADLRDADLCNAILSGAKLDGVIYNATTAFFALQCPEEGGFIGWKKCCGGEIVKLLIPEGAKRSSATTRKCRCDKAKVLEIWNRNGKSVLEACSKRDSEFVYRVGETVSVPNFDEDRWHECAPGIHFFITRREAELYG